MLHFVSAFSRCYLNPFHFRNIVHTAAMNIQRHIFAWRSLFLHLCMGEVYAFPVLTIELKSPSHYMDFISFIFFFSRFYFRGKRGSFRLLYVCLFRISSSLGNSASAGAEGTASSSLWLLLQFRKDSFNIDWGMLCSWPYLHNTSESTPCRHLSC